MKNYKFLGISMITSVFFFFWAMSFVKEINIKFHFSFFFLSIALANVVEIIILHLAYKKDRRVINASVPAFGVNIPAKLAIFWYIFFSGFSFSLVLKIFLLNRLEIMFFAMAHGTHVFLLGASFVALCIMFYFYVFVRRDSILKKLVEDKNS